MRKGTPFCEKGCLVSTRSECDKLHEIILSPNNFVVKITVNYFVGIIVIYKAQPSAFMFIICVNQQ